jgi:hypothetical protein
MDNGSTNGSVKYADIGPTKVPFTDRVRDVAELRRKDSERRVGQTEMTMSVRFAMLGSAHCAIDDGSRQRSRVQ